MNINSDELRSIVNRLDGVTNILTNELIEFEKELNKIGFGVAAWVTDEKGNRPTKLGYLKYDKEWGLYVQYYEPDEEEPHIHRLIKARRSLRLWGYKRRYSIIPALVACASKLADRMEKALEGEDDASRNEAALLQSSKVERSTE